MSGVSNYVSVAPGRIAQVGALQVAQLTADPDLPTDGSADGVIWYNATDNVWKSMINGVVRTITTTSTGDITAVVAGTGLTGGGTSGSVTLSIDADGVGGTQLSSSAERFLAFTGSNGAGACTATGTKVGDKVIGVVNLTDGTTATSSFESTITVANQIQQSSASDLSTKKFSLLVVAKS